MRRRTMTSTLGVLALAGVLAATGCGATESAKNAAGKGLRVAPATFPVSLNIYQYPAEAAVQGPVQHVLETLVTRSGNDYQPRLATKWSQPNDTTWTFTLRSGVKFSDGKALTADDVKASADALIKAGSSLAPLWEPVKSVTATDEHTVTITTAQPLGTMLATVSLLPITEAGKASSESYWKKPIGTGPYTVKEWSPDKQLVLSRNAKYWGAKPSIPAITYLNIPEESARITALSTGEADVTNGIGADSVDQVKKMPGVTYDTKPGYSYEFIWFNSSRKPFTDKRVRQALWYAVDVKQIVGDLYGEQAKLAQAPIPQPVFGAPQLSPYPYDPAKAKKLLAEAGYPHGFSTTIQWASSDDTNQNSLGQAFVSYWAKIGVKVKPLPKERSVWLEDLNKLKWDMNLQGNTVATGDADYTLGRLYTCDAKRMGYCNHKLDSLLAQAKATLDPAERTALYKQAAQIIWSDAVGIFPADFTVDLAYRKNVTGLTIDPAGRQSFVHAKLTN
ncbi:ABC transporter substrate-binding protein [Actinocatenispora sera]|uniref:ABC transporter substrate-binding protein n=1 Tax=Actinocatenispora sera TaxID=390989 RepID=UPI0033C7E06C